MKRPALSFSLAVGLGLPLLLSGLLGGCERSDQPAKPRGDADTEAALTAVTEAGPVKATVSLTPAAPRLGDPLTLTLTVEAEPGVRVDMPAFGEALGRFSIIDFTPREDSGADGSVIASQRYRLQPPMSGRQRIPSLRIEFTDERDAGANPEYEELLTDELTVEVISVLPDGAVTDTLRPVRGELPIRRGWLGTWWPALLLAALLLAVAAVCYRLWRSRAAQRAQVTAYDQALTRLVSLERQGLPDEQNVDGWYVELSDIVRRYIENRYALRAPELTTEEFLQAARRSNDLSDDHRAVLTALLERCDVVKFARHTPGDDESRDALGVARRFLDETRLDAGLDRAA